MEDYEYLDMHARARCPQELISEQCGLSGHGISALMTAASHHDESTSVSLMSDLIAHGASVTASDRIGRTALHWACSSQPPSGHGSDASTSMGADARVTLLLQHGADARVSCSAHGETPLHLACRYGHCEAIRSLYTFSPIHAKPDARALSMDLLSAHDVAGYALDAGNSFTPATRARALACLHEFDHSLRVLVQHHPECLAHENNIAQHQEAPQRVEAILQAVQHGFTPLEVDVRDDAPCASASQVTRAHSRSYWGILLALHEVVSARHLVEGVPLTPMVQRSLRHIPPALVKQGSNDTGFGPGTLRACTRAAGAVCRAVEAVADGLARHALCVVRPPGHHAGVNGLPSRKLYGESAESCGFCVINNVAIGALHAHAVRPHSMRRVAIVDIDAHHGNGTEEIVREWARAHRGSSDGRALFFFSVHLHDVERVPMPVKVSVVKEGRDGGVEGEEDGAGKERPAPTPERRRVTRGQSRDGPGSASSTSVSRSRRPRSRSDDGEGEGGEGDASRPVTKRLRLSTSGVAVVSGVAHSSAPLQWDTKDMPVGIRPLQSFPFLVRRALLSTCTAPTPTLGPGQGRHTLRLIRTPPPPPPPPPPAPVEDEGQDEHPLPSPAAPRASLTLQVSVASAEPDKAESWRVEDAVQRGEEGGRTAFDLHLSAGGIGMTPTARRTGSFLPVGSPTHGASTGEKAVGGSLLVAGSPTPSTAPAAHTGAPIDTARPPPLSMRRQPTFDSDESVANGSHAPLTRLPSFTDSAMSPGSALTALLHKRDRGRAPAASPLGDGPAVSGSGRSVGMWAGSSAEAESGQPSVWGVGAGLQRDAQREAEASLAEPPSLPPGSILWQFYPGTGDRDVVEANVINAPVPPLWRERKEAKKDRSRARVYGWQAVRRVVDDRLIPALRAFGPDLILISAGFDGGAGDYGNTCNYKASKVGPPPGGMNLRPEDFSWITSRILDVARVCCPGRVVAVLEGGYGRVRWRKEGEGVIAGGGAGAVPVPSHPPVTDCGIEGYAALSPVHPEPMPDASVLAEPYLDREPLANNCTALLRALVDDGASVLAARREAHALAHRTAASTVQATAGTVQDEE